MRVKLVKKKKKKQSNKYKGLFLKNYTSWNKKYIPNIIILLSFGIGLIHSNKSQ